MGSTRDKLRALIAGNLEGDQLATGTVAASPAPAASAFKVAELVGLPPNSLTGKLLTLSSGTYKDLDRTIASYDDIGQLVTLRVAFAGAPTAADKVEIYKNFTKTEYDKCISQAIESAKVRFMYDKVDRTTLIAASTYEYAVPSGFAYISRLVLETATGQYTADIPDSWWEFIIKGTPAAVYIKFFISAEVLSYAGYHIEIQGQAYPSDLTADTGTTNVPDDYIVAWAAMMMALRKPMSVNDTMGWINKVNNWRSTTRDILALQSRPVPAGSRIVPIVTG